MNKSKFAEWRSSPHTQRIKHLCLARLWLAFGILGAAQYFKNHGIGDLFSDVASSIAALFFISVYANFEAHRAEAGTYRVEENQDSGPAS